MRISDWSSDVCSSDLVGSARALARLCRAHAAYRWLCGGVPVNYHGLSDFRTLDGALLDRILTESVTGLAAEGLVDLAEAAVDGTRSEEHTSELQSLMRISYAVFCLKKTKVNNKK